MKYIAAVMMLKNMLKIHLLDEQEYTILEDAYAEKYRPDLRFRFPGTLSVEAGCTKKGCVRE